MSQFGLAIGGAVLGGALGILGSSSSNRAVRRQASAQRAIARDQAAVERMQRINNAAQVRGRIRVLAADSGAVDPLRDMASARSVPGLLGSARSLFGGSDDPARPTSESLAERFVSRLDGGDPRLADGESVHPLLRQLGVDGSSGRDRTVDLLGEFADFIRAESPADAPRGTAPTADLIPAGATVPTGAGSWEAIERSFTINLVRDLFLVDRNLDNQIRAIDAGAAASTRNPLLDGLGGAFDLGLVGYRLGNLRPEGGQPQQPTII